MSNLNPLEFRKWQPRQPSPKIYARLFRAGQGAPGAELTFHLRDLSQWLVPAFGCFLLAMASLSTHLPPRYSLQLAATNFVLPTLTDEPSAVMLPGSPGHSGVNAVPAKRLEWNFGARSEAAATGVGSLLISYTNKLIQ